MIFRLAGLAIFLIALIWLVLSSIDLEKVGVLMSQFPKWELIGLMGLSVIISFLKGLRFFWLLRDIKLPVSFWQSLKVYISGQAVSPLPGGEAARSFFLTKEIKQKFADVSGPVVSQAFLELLTAITLTAIGSFVFKVLRLPATLLFIFAIGLGIFLSSKKVFNYFLNGLKRMSFLKDLVKQLKIVQSGVRFNKVLYLTLIISLLSSLLGGLILLLISRQFNVTLDIIKSVFIYSSGVVITGLVAVVPGGLGFTEGGMTGLLLFNGVDLSTALAIILLFRVVTFVFPTALGLIFLLTFYGKIIFKKK